jgi:type II secretory ATPase GspE/PulE/Tfp pilus assembly ATPase PilB-like protein
MMMEASFTGGDGNGALAMLGAGLTLVSWGKPLAVVASLTVWAWVVSTIYDKDAAQWYLPRERWNWIHFAAGVGAVVVVVVLPMSFWVTWPVMSGILAADLISYAAYRNTSSKVPASGKWSINFKEMQARAESRKKGKNTKGITLTIKGPDGTLTPPEKDAPEFEVRVWVEELLEGLVEARGTQMDIQPIGENRYGISFLVDGVRKAAEKAHSNKAVAIIDQLKQAAGLDIEDRRRRLIGDIEFGQHGSPLLVARVTSAGSSKGMKLSVMLDPVGQVSRTIAELGMHENQLKVMLSMVSDAKGAVLLAGMPDGGRTQSLYAIMKKHDAYTSNVQTIEMEPQGVIEGVRQNVWESGGEAEYSTTVRSILRRDPDVVGIADMLDEATAKEVSQADHERTRTYLSMKCGGALQAVQLYARAVGDQKLAAESLHGVVGQKLMRKLCPNCRTPFKPTPEQLKKLGLPKDTKQLFRKSGQVLVKEKPQTCQVCQGAGFFGQMGVFEVHEIDSAQRKLIAQNDLTGLRATFRQKKQQSFQHAALQHVVLGNTSVEEVVRVSQPAGAKKPSTGEAKPAQAAAPSKG